MKSFLDQVAEKILDKHPHPAKACAVLPSRRAGVFLKKSIAAKAAKSMMMPTICSMQDYVLARTGLRLADSITLTFELYEVHKEVMKEKAEPFKDFLKYATTIINDFNDIDLHLIEPSEAFKFLRNVSQLNIWQPGENEKNDYQKKYLEFFESLEDYYLKFRERLLKKKMVYQGLAFRELAQQEPGQQKKWDKVYFTGFNFFTPSEEKIADNLVKEKQAELIWDIDRFYYDDPAHEAGKSLRRLTKKWPAFTDFHSENLTQTEKTITVTGAPGGVSQVKEAGNILKNFDENDEVAVVLADESLLEPLINSIPGNISKFNITMGLALENTMLFSLFSALFRLHTAPYGLENAKSNGGDVQYYFKDVLRVLSHPAITKVFESRHTDFSLTGKSPVKMIQLKDKAFYSLNDLRNLFKEIGVEAFDDYAFLWNDWNQQTANAITCFLKLLDLLLDETDMQEDENPLLKEYALRFQTVIQKINHLQTAYGTLEDTDIFWRLFRQLTSREEVSFRGEPLKGIQVMGMLETRLLDFKNVILLSANEEFVPGNSDDVTFIPFEMRLYYKLPMKSEKAGIYAYHFYHLLQRSENIHLLYNNHPEGVSSNEVSRFVKQIKYELAHANQQLKVVERVVSVSPDLSENDYEISVKKSPALIERLREKAKSGFSATSLNKYRQCSLKFYFEEILGVSEQEEVEETIEAKTLGIVVHQVLENFYKPDCGEYPLKSDFIVKLKKHVPEELDKTFKELYSGNSFAQGKNLLISKLAEHWIESFLEKELVFALKAEKSQTEYAFKGTELYIEKHLNLNEHLPVKFKGHIDRVDRVDNVTRIIDYKTGNVNPSKLTVKEMEDFFSRSDNKEAFQLLFYQWLYQQSSHYDKGMVEPAIISFPALQQGVMSLKNAAYDSSELIASFEEHLMNLVSNIFDDQTPFSQTEDISLCRFCDFKSTCNRYS